MSNQLKPYTIDDYEKFLSENLGYDKNLPMTICMDTCEYFKDRDTIIDEAELVEWICDRLKEENLIGFTTDFIIAKLIEEELLEVISIGSAPFCRTFKFMKIEKGDNNGKEN